MGSDVDVIITKMAAPAGRVLLSGRIFSRSGVFVSDFRRPAPTLISSRVENAQKLHTKSPLRPKAEQEESSSYRGSFYVGGTKASNPMKKVGLAWAIGFPSGILLFLFAKSKVEQRRVDQMKARQRMRDANKGEYESNRYGKSV